MRQFKAFTLAEVLAVIGIIGVVAALTLPNLSTGTDDLEYVAAFKKTTASLQNALDLAKDKYGDYSVWTASVSSSKDKAAIVGNRLSDYIVPSKTCGSQSGGGCFAYASVSSISGNTVTSYDSDANTYKFILKDGTSVAFSDSNLVKIDLDGPHKGYNAVGRDIFNVAISSEGNLDFVAKTNLNSSNITACRSGNATMCAAWVEAFDNNDFIHCSSLAYNGNVTCK